MPSKGGQREVNGSQSSTKMHLKIDLRKRSRTNHPKEGQRAPNENQRDLKVSQRAPKTTKMVTKFEIKPT